MATTKKPAATKTAAKKPAATKAAPAAKAAKTAPGKQAASTSAAPKEKRAPNAAFMKELTPSDLLASVVGSKPLPRTEVVKKMWDYIKQHKLQDAANKRMINADDKLKGIFGKPQVSMFEMTKIVNEHLK
jgi:upstream activation factor subunit UAF30